MILLYSNGIVEELKPIEHTFSEDELLRLFDGYHMLKSKRLSEVPNVWCLWGVMENPPNNEFHKIGSEINHEYIFSHIVFIHDTEIDLDWNIVDTPIYFSYDEFIENIKIFIDVIAGRIYERDRKSMAASMIFLVPIGQTDDKRVLYGFNPHEQSDTFFSDGSFNIFADKIYDYLNENFELEKPFKIFADSKNIVVVEDLMFGDVIDEMIKIYEPDEKYEKCSKLAEIKKVWKKEIKSRSKRNDN